MGLPLERSHLTDNLFPSWEGLGVGSSRARGGSLHAAESGAIAVNLSANQRL